MGIVKLLEGRGYLVSHLESKKTGKYKIVELTGSHPNIKAEVIHSNMDRWTADQTVEIHNKNLKK